MGYTKYHVYIISNFKRTTFYIGVTNNLRRRVDEHKQSLIEGFSKKYQLKYLVYFEEYSNINEAIKREKQIKNWHRACLKTMFFVISTERSKWRNPLKT